MKWSALDQSPVSEGRGEDQAIRDSLVLAQDCDRLGYERYWLSEHHALASVAGTAPEVLAAAVAATTRRIRVGSAGIMLPHYSALKVAEQFRWALAADTPAQAQKLLTAREHWRVGFEKGLRVPLVSPEKAAGHPYTPAEQATLERLRAAAFAGSAVQVAGRLRELGERLELDEIVINTWTYDPEARRHSYALLAEAFELHAGSE
jgi:alkanesulfonate monooxygenase SsuD/methylene tetrahydromethanopterin reductase-like flavin-dependent oxidoreductase (luciferase family)